MTENEERGADLRESSPADEQARSQSARRVHRSRVVPLVMFSIVCVVLGFGLYALRHARSEVNEVALSAEPKAVTAVQARAADFRRIRRYVGTLRPWQKARIGPQLASGFVSAVLVRPGDVVKRGAVLARLDCRNASAASKAVRQEVRALETRQRAVAQEASRIEEMLEGGYVSDNEVEQKLAQASATEARIQALLAEAQGKRLAVDDCVLRAPFDGEVSERHFDPGAFVRPGTSIITLISRDTVRLTADVPEVDFQAVAPGTPVRIRLISTEQQLTGSITRRSPSADAETRTIHIEIDITDTQRKIPVGSTAVIELDVGEPHPSIELPLAAVTIRGKVANLFVVESNRVRKEEVDVLGERGGSVFVSTALAVDAAVVTQGRSLLSDGDRVAVKTEVWP